MDRFCWAFFTQKPDWGVGFSSQVNSGTPPRMQYISLGLGTEEMEKKSESTTCIQSIRIHHIPPEFLLLSPLPSVHFQNTVSLGSEMARFLVLWNHVLYESGQNWAALNTIIPSTFVGASRQCHHYTMDIHHFFTGKSSTIIPRPPNCQRNLRFSPVLSPQAPDFFKRTRYKRQAFSRWNTSCG